MITAAIKQLPQSVANQISAGEVIERPASVVKELVENSIDAGSSQILIEIDSGGKERIRVKDNGSGIKADELELAFSRYATSKIEDINDLYSLTTLGFRGEALASIASVARLEVRSRTEKELKGSYMCLEGGKPVSRQTVGAPRGTDIIVQDIFFNTPARYKYLKTTSTEFAHISEVINREAMAYPEISFHLKHNERLVLQTPGSGRLTDTLYAIYGEELVSRLIEVDFEDRYVQVNGFIARPDFNRASRQYQFFFVNRRSVYNQGLHRGVEEGYRGLLPPSRYPVVFLNLKLNQILVDVNVHPSKREIKFSRNQIIQDILGKGVKKHLREIDTTPRINIKKAPDKGAAEKSKRLPFREQSGKRTAGRNDISDSQDFQGTNEKRLKEDNNKYLTTHSTDTDNNIDTNTDVAKSYHSHHKQKRYIENYPAGKDSVSNNVEPEHGAGSDFVKKILGQIHSTYLLVEIEDGLYIIDQHNAHERVLYDRIRQRYNQGSIVSQPLLVPVNLELSLPESEILKKYRAQLEKLGFVIESFGGNSYLVQEVPSIIKDQPVKQSIRELIDRLTEEGRSTEPAGLIDELITYMACRGAVKAGMRMDDWEISELINDLFNCDNSGRCPHGRPIILHLTMTDLEKSMGRK